jgi:hypothetical protein
MVIDVENQELTASALRTAGFAMECVGPKGGVWNEFTSSTRDCHDERGADLCPSSSGFRLRDTFGFAHERVWACHDLRTAKITCNPPIYHAHVIGASRNAGLNAEGWSRLVEVPEDFVCPAVVDKCAPLH